MNRVWFSRAPLLLALGLISLALGVFIAWRGWWDGLFGLLGVALLAAWVVRSSRPSGTWRGERRTLVERRRQAVPVAVERRRFAERRAA